MEMIKKDLEKRSHVLEDGGIGRQLLPCCQSVFKKTPINLHFHLLLWGKMFGKRSISRMERLVTQQNRVKPVPTYVYVRGGFSYDSQDNSGWKEPQKMV